MGIIADLISAGVAPALVDRVAMAIAEARAEGAMDLFRSSRSANAARQARFRERHSVTNNATNATSVTPVPPMVPPRDNNSTPSLTTSRTTEGARAGSRLPEGFSPSLELRAFGQSQGLSDAEIDTAAAEFADYWRGIPGAKGRKLDWDATLRNRLREIAGRKARWKGQTNGKQSVQDAARDLAERASQGLVDFGPVPPVYLPSRHRDAQSRDSARLLSEGGRGEPRDLRGGSGVGLVLLPGADRLSGDGPEDWPSGQEPMASNGR